jgi:hypothetical protein
MTRREEAMIMAKRSRRPIERDRYDGFRIRGLQK